MRQCVLLRQYVLVRRCGSMSWWGGVGGMSHVLSGLKHCRLNIFINIKIFRRHRFKHIHIGSNYDSLFVRTVAFPVQVAYWIKEVIAPCGTSVPCQLRPEVRRHGRGVLWTGGDPCMTGCLECPLASPVFAQSWSQTATDGAWYSTTALLSGRDRPRCLCVLRLSGSEPKTRRTGNVATSLPSISLPVGARW